MVSSGVKQARQPASATQMPTRTKVRILVIPNFGCAPRPAPNQIPVAYSFKYIAVCLSVFTKTKTPPYMAHPIRISAKG